MYWRIPSNLSPRDLEGITASLSVVPSTPTTATTDPVSSSDEGMIITLNNV